MDIQVERVTPAKAQQWLNVNKTNRSLRDGVAEKYADDMRNGRWTACPVPISFYEDGDLADGQHRLFAIVESGTTQTFPVARGLTRHDGLNIDTGLPRNLVDNARISGDGADLSYGLLATAKAMEFGTPKTTIPLSSAARLALVQKHREHAQFAQTNVKRVRGLSGSTVTAAVGRAHMHEADADRLKRFCDVLGSGLYNGDDETPAIALRNYYLQKGQVVSHTALWRDTFLKSMNAISYFMRGRKLTVIKSVSEEAYPLIDAPQEQQEKKAARTASARKTIKSLPRTKRG